MIYICVICDKLLCHKYYHFGISVNFLAAMIFFHPCQGKLITGRRIHLTYYGLSRSRMFTYKSIHQQTCFMAEVLELIYFSLICEIYDTSFISNVYVGKFRRKLNVVCTVHLIAVCRWPKRCTILISNFYSTVFSCSTCFERIYPFNIRSTA